MTFKPLRVRYVGYLDDERALFEYELTPERLRLMAGILEAAARVMEIERNERED